MDIRLIPTSELSPYLTQLNVLINDAFDQQDRSKLEANAGPLFGGQRIKSHDQLLLELGSQGISAIAFDTIPGEATSKPEPVAVAVLKPWKGKVVDLWDAHLVKTSGVGGGEILASDSETNSPLSGTDSPLGRLKPNNWEIATCASRKDPKYRGQGLITSCIDVLIDHLKRSQHETAREYEPIMLWVSVLEGVGNVEYWQRRGYERYGDPDVVPKGVWSSLRSFEIGTLRKVAS